ncbi:MAG: O-methyltransferase [Prevotellaceae bacterium]|jgi:predicted O-methyltransferase YrrM|nr:O-methyltransferase [Prevotellaceae bacterium]
MLDKDREIEKYIAEHTSAEDKLLHEIYRKTNLSVIQTRMISGHVQGKILEFLSKMIKPKNILEIGTFTGYSAICLAKGLQADGELHSIDINDEILETAKFMIDKSQYADKIYLHEGDAKDVIPALNKKFDIVFIDGDKRCYVDNYKAVFDLVNIGGFIFADNVLWNGKVIEPIKPNDRQTAGIMEFNDFVQNDSRVENVLFNVRDGMMIVRKLKNR